MKPLALVLFALTSLSTVVCHADEPELPGPNEAVPLWDNPDLISRDKDSLFHVFEGIVTNRGPKEGQVTGKVIAYTSLATGKMRFILMTGLVSNWNVPGTTSMSRLVGLVQDRHLLYAVIIDASEVEGKEKRIGYADSAYFLVVFRKSDGSAVFIDAFPAKSKTLKDWPKETTEAGLIKKLDKGIEVFGTVIEFTDDGKLIRKEVEKPAKDKE